LQNQKEQTESMYKRYGGKIIQSKIVTQNNIPFFVFQDQDGEEMSLSFMMSFKNRKTLFCMLNYKINDEDKAQKIFKNILNSVRYKN